MVSLYLERTHVYDECGTRLSIKSVNDSNILIAKRNSLDTISRLLLFKFGKINIIALDQSIP